MSTQTPTAPFRSVDPAKYRRQAVNRCHHCQSPARTHVFTFKSYELARCKNCDLAYITNPPTAEDLQHFYSFASSYHSDFATSEASRTEFLERGRTYMQYLTPHIQRGKLLDVGCSAGFFMKVANDQGFNVSGLEYSPDSAQLGSELYDLAIEVGCLDSPPFDDESFDVLTMWDVIEHLPNPAAALSQAFDLLASGGFIALSTPNIDGIFPKSSYLVAKPLNYWPHPAPPAHLTQFSTKTLANMLKNAGFEIVQAKTRRIPLDYSFGTLGELLRMPKRLVYAAIFAPIAFLGPLIGQGDEVVMIARKP